LCLLRKPKRKTYLIKLSGEKPIVGKNIKRKENQKLVGGKTKGDS